MSKCTQVLLLGVGTLLGIAVFLVGLPSKIFTKASSRGVLMADHNCHDCIGGPAKTV